ncbi:CDK-activating kinase assembly factor MAT1-domain-containing protein [Lasiosphaeria miniovina]|uniref:RNA polymerase II transcription factor B subunit 3 n=1 Tax=Lasiosphaeria miniovina TaxID=1954250 RepID=A0AA40BG09_9PEZI|nr:CDK-activating kinase assembly factor MAT1-domain-containing protein [Lasiosphaeria miniovina]KAK0733529.1 CDK-activating kinase assembly factor MAT1-domain-containing protein [Lasiosphaeria miniovina]
MPVLTSDDMCPVCKMIRYLNKDMEFLINPECYHSMCSNCVNRLFNDGPNQCPYAGCHKTLRRKGFRSAFFGDLTVEREVDIRRRVAAVFNRVEDDFETLRDYNNYLQMVEDLTFDLVSGTDARRHDAEATLQQWEASHKAEIERNRKAGRDADEMTRRRVNAEREAARQRRVDALREAEDEKVERARSREAELDSLAQGAAPGGGDGQRVQLKRPGPAAGSSLASASFSSASGALADVGRLSIRGLKEKRKPAAAEGPYDPFGGMDFVPSRYRVREGLDHPWLNKYRLDRSYATGGYTFNEYTHRAMFEAFAGLGVFVDDEKEVGIGLSAREVATIGAGIAAVGDRMELD